MADNEEDMYDMTVFTENKVATISVSIIIIAFILYLCGILRWVDIKSKTNDNETDDDSIDEGN